MEDHGRELGTVTLGTVTVPKIRTTNLRAVDGLIGPKDLTVEVYREYEFLTVEGRPSYRISNPVALYYREGGTTHRVVDSEGRVHCVPFGPGVILRWLNKGSDPVGF